MPIPYFEKIPTMGYDISGDGEKRLAVNILQRVKIRDILKQNYFVWYEYDVKDGETPEIIADKLYGSAQYHWIVLLANDIVDPYYDWPMSQDTLLATIRKKYSTPTQDGLRFAYQTIHHYEDKFGVEIDETTYKTLPDAERTAVSIYDYEINDNERKRRIRLLDKLYVDQIDAEMNDIMKRVLV